MSALSDPVGSLPVPPSRTEQVYEAIVDDICTGKLNPGSPLRQEQLAERFGVSRQPIQQALLLLRSHGLVREFGRRGLEVAPLEADFVRQLYELRWALDGHAARLAARRRSDEWVAQTAAIVHSGEQAFYDRAFSHMISSDIEFHRAVVEAADNPLLAESAAVMWRNVQRVMGEVLLKGGSPAWVWQDHAAILDAIDRGDPDEAESLARRHAEHGEQLILDGMMPDGPAPAPPAQAPRGTRRSLKSTHHGAASPTGVSSRPVGHDAGGS